MRYGIYEKHDLPNFIYKVVAYRECNKLCIITKKQTSSKHYKNLSLQKTTKKYQKTLDIYLQNMIK